MGVRAASLMGQVRHRIRALAAVDLAPSAVLDGLDRLFSGFADEDLVTLVYALLHPRTGRYDLVNAGHVPPLLLSTGDSAQGADREDDTVLAVRRLPG